MAIAKKSTKTVKEVINKEIKCICLKRITTVNGSFDINKEVVLTEEEFNYFDKLKAVKR